MAKKHPPQPATLAEPASVVYVLSLALTNVRCFGPTQTLTLADKTGKPARWTILLGDNGTGKTTILQAIALFEPVLLSRIVQPVHERLMAFRRAATNETSLSLDIACGPALDHSNGEYQRHNRQICVASNGPSFELYPNQYSMKCCGYGASRRLGSTSLAEPIEDDPTGSLFTDDYPLRNAEEWLLRLDYSASKPSEVQQQQQRRLELVKKLLIELLPDVRAIRFSEPTATKPMPGVEFNTVYGWVGLRALGHGYRTLIAWVVDFASRLFDRDPDGQNPLAQPAVALIDEIDLHLHPVWQRKVMRHLTECFPNTQFIVTAHSPLLVQAADEEANIALLRREDDHVIIDNDVARVRGWRIDQLLTSDLFGLPSTRPPQFDELFARRKRLLEKPNLTRQDRQELADIEEKIGPLPVGETAEAARLLSEIRQTLQTLEEQRVRP